MPHSWHDAPEAMLLFKNYYDTNTECKQGSYVQNVRVYEVEKIDLEDYSQKKSLANFNLVFKYK